MMRRRAFTLLELLLATMLATLLMGLILTFSASLRRTQHASADDYLMDTASGQFERLLHRDLAMADDFQIRSGSVAIEGYSRLDVLTQEPRQGPTRITYRLVPLGGHGYLIRQQSELDSRTNQETQVEMVLAGVSSFSLAAAQPVESPGVAIRAGGRAQDVWLSLSWEDAARPPLNKLMLLR